MSRAWIMLLSLILMVWFPFNFSAELSTTLPSLGMRGGVAVLELAVHGAVAALCAAAGLSLWTSRPHGPVLARLALVSSALVSVQSLYWSTLPSQIIPGDELPLAAVAIAHSAVWLVYLARSRAVRALGN